MNYFNNINLNQNELQKAVMHPLAQAPATAKPGQMYYNTGDKKLYYYNGADWIGLNDVDISGKLDKQTTTDNNTQVYAVTGGTQKMIDATNAATANTVVFRDVNGRFQAAAGENDKDVVNRGQMNTAIEGAVSGLEHVDNKVGAITGIGDDIQYPNTKAVVDYVKGQVSKVKDVTLDGTSIVDEQGIVELESTYSVTLSGINGTLTQAQYDNLVGDDASYIWYTQSDAQPMRLIKVMSGEGNLRYQTVVSDTVLAIVVESTKAWQFLQFTVEDAANKTTALSNNSTDTQYPSGKAVVTYVKNNSAPTNHATIEETYGLGTQTKYGHVKLVSGDMNGKGYTDGQVPALNHEHGQYAKLSGAIFTGDIQVGATNPTIISTNGNVTIAGNLTVKGTTTTVESTTLKVKDQLIEVASGNTTALTSPAGLVVPKYNGTDSGAIVFDSTGTAYVGDVVLDANGLVDTSATGTKLVALAGRDKEANLTNNHILKWDGTNKILVDTGIDASNILTNGDLPSDYVSTTKTGTQTIASELCIKTGNKATTYGNGVIRYTTDGETEYSLNLPQKGGTVAILDEVVTLSGAQTVTGAKTFKAEVAFDNQIRANGGVGTLGQVLTSQGAGKAPQWTTLSMPQGTVKKLSWSIVGDGVTTTFESNNTLSTAECTVAVYLQVSGATWELVMTDVVVTASKIQVIFAQAPTNEQSFRVVVTG